MGMVLLSIYQPFNVNTCIGYYEQLTDYGPYLEVHWSDEQRFWERSVCLVGGILPADGLLKHTGPLQQRGEVRTTTETPHGGLMREVRWEK